MNFEIISSSSKGNCIIIENVLMLDCGVSYKKIKEYIKNVKLIFISHSHQDHLNKKTIEKIKYLFPTIKFLTGSNSVLNVLVDIGVSKKNIIILPTKKWYDLGLLKVKLEELYHDTPNYALKWQINGKKGVYIVDTASVDNIKAQNYNLYLIESNFNNELLQEHINNCDDDNLLYYLNRVPKTHLSDIKCNDFLINNMGEDSEYIKIHKSSYNYKEID